MQVVVQSDSHKTILKEVGSNGYPPHTHTHTPVICMDHDCLRCGVLWISSIYVRKKHVYSTLAKVTCTCTCRWSSCYSMCVALYRYVPLWRHSRLRTGWGRSVHNTLHVFLTQSTWETTPSHHHRYMHVHHVYILYTWVSRHLSIIYMLHVCM